jgi:NADH:ubiquinone oxidoreductase subunit
MISMVYARYWSMEIFTFFKGSLIGKDHQGNRYYQERFLFKKAKRKQRRWVMYRGIMEGSRVPAEWFGWLHHSLDVPLDSTLKSSWQKPHQSNQTGTSLAYRPSMPREGTQKSVPEGYEPWRPS